jgi:hypothetical protein
MCFAWAARKGSADPFHQYDSVANSLKAKQLALSQQWVAQWVDTNSAALSLPSPGLPL